MPFKLGPPGHIYFASVACNSSGQYSPPPRSLVRGVQLVLVRSSAAALLHHAHERERSRPGPRARGAAERVGEGPERARRRTCPATCTARCWREAAERGRGGWACTQESHAECSDASVRGEAAGGSCVAAHALRFSSLTRLQAEALRKRIEQEAQRVQERKAAGLAAAEAEQRRARAAAEVEKRRRLQSGFTAVRAPASVSAPNSSCSRSSPLLLRPCSGWQQPPRRGKRRNQPAPMLHGEQQTRPRWLECWAR